MWVVCFILTTKQLQDTLDLAQDVANSGACELEDRNFLHSFLETTRDTQTREETSDSRFAIWATLMQQQIIAEDKAAHNEECFGKKQKQKKTNFLFLPWWRSELWIYSLALQPNNILGQHWSDSDSLWNNQILFRRNFSCVQFFSLVGFCRGYVAGHFDLTVDNSRTFKALATKWVVKVSERMISLFLDDEMMQTQETRYSFIEILLQEERNHNTSHRFHQGVERDV